MKRHWILVLMLIVAAFAFQGCQTRQDANEEQAEARDEAPPNANEPYQETPAETADNDVPGVADEAADEIGDAADKTADTAEKAADSDTAQNVEESLEEAGSEVKDAGITTAVKAKFAVDDVVKAAKIDVDTENGIVTLNGSVGSQKESTRAVELAESVDGVKTVRNKLTVSPS